METKEKLSGKFRPRIKHIRTKYGLQIVFIIVLVSVMLTFLALQQFQKGMKTVSESVERLTGETLYEQMEKKAEVVITILSKDLINPFYYLDIETICDLLATVKAYEDVAYVYLYDAEARIVTDGTGENPRLGEILPDEIRKKSLSDKEFLLQRKGDILDAFMPVYIHDEHLGGVRVGFYLSEIKTEILNQKRAIASITQNSARNTFVASAVTSGVLVFLGIFFALRIAQDLVRPLLKLTQAAGKIGKGDLTTKVDIKSGDELEELAGSFNRMAVDLYDQQQELETLHNSAKALTGNLEIDPLLDRTLNTVRKILKVSKGSIMLLEGDFLVIKGSFGWKSGEVARGKPFSIGEGIAGVVAQRKKSVLANDLDNHPLFKKEEEDNRVWRGCRDLLCVPMVYEDKLKGVINIQDRMDGEPFTRTDVEYAEIIASSAALSLMNIELVEEEIEKTRMEEEIKRLEEFSIKDGLTELFNYRYFSGKIDELFQTAQENKTHLSCLLIDVDFFKSVNDTCNHQFGDFVLYELGVIFNGVLRKNDVLARYGGDEFVVLFPDTDYDEALSLAKRINRIVGKELFKDKNFSKKNTVSIGISSYPHDKIEVKDQLVKFADEALYKAKNSGRNTVFCYKNIKKKRK